MTHVSAPNKWAACYAPRVARSPIRARRGTNPIGRAARREDHAILAALEKQRSIGLDILSDGEMRRGSWLTDMADAVEGFVREKVTLEWKGPGGGAEGSTAQAAGAKLRKARKLTGHELPLLKQAARGPFKITLPAPSNFVLASYKPGVTDAVLSNACRSAAGPGGHRAR